MMSLRFDPGSTSKTLNLSLLRFDEWFGSENLGQLGFQIFHYFFKYHNLGGQLCVRFQWIHLLFSFYNYNYSALCACMPINVFSILFFLVRIETLERNSTCLQAGEILANQSFLSLFWFLFFKLCELRIAHFVYAPFEQSFKYTIISHVAMCLQ